MDRNDLKTLADARVADAQALIAAGRWPAAYYLLGYAVECALKAVAAKRFREHEVPDKQVVIDFYTHDLKTKLLGVAELGRPLETRLTADPSFQISWKQVCDWNEAKRYEPNIAEKSARDMLVAVTDPASGVLPWLKTQW